MPTACQLCPSPQATVHLTELSADGTRSEVHVCRECVARLGIAVDNPPPLAPLLIQAQALAQAGSEDGAVDSVSVPAPADGEACLHCGLEFTAYAQSNLFGCADCYQTFAPQVAELVQRYHGATRHVGRVPGGVTAPEPKADQVDANQLAKIVAEQRRIAKHSARQSLTLALADAIAREQFERAAALRDQLSALDDERAEGVV